MAIDTKTPMALYKANLELVMRLGALLQENRRRWTRFGVASSDDAIERTLDETGRMLTSNDWQSLASLPGESFWRALQGDVGQMQGALDTAVGNQTAFAQGLQEAFTAWQQQCADVIEHAGGSMPGKAGFDEFLQTFTSHRTPGASAPAPVAARAAKSPARKVKPRAAARPAKAAAKAKSRPKPKAAKPKVSTARASKWAGPTT